MIYIEDSDPDQFVNKNREVIEDLFLQANSFCLRKEIDIPRDRDEERELYSVLVASAVYIRSNKVTGVLEFEDENDEAEFVKLVRLLLAAKIIWKLEDAGLCCQNKDGSYKVLTHNEL